MPKYNKAQQAAIDATNRTVLASAGAGAGKTSVMTERIGQQILRHGKKIDQMLVVTFTKEAAYSMREKIRKYLQDVSHNDQETDETRTAAAEAAMQMSVCHISTIHSFCKTVLQAGYMLVDIDPTFDIVDDAIRRGYFELAVKQAVDNIAGPGYSKEDKQLFGYLKRAVSARDLVELCLTLHEELMGLPEPYEQMHEMISMADLPAEKNPWAQEVIRYNQQRLKQVVGSIDKIRQIMDMPDFPAKNVPAAEKDIELLTDLAVAMDSGAGADKLSGAVNMVLKNAPSMTQYSARGLNADSKEVYALYQAVHKSMISDKTSILQKVSVELEAVTSATAVRDNKHIKNQLLGLEILIREVGKCFTEIKTANGQLDFSDLEQFAYRILTDKAHPEVKDAICKNFTDVYVDECQDVSGIQYAILTALQTAETNMFFVGDIKQSIYRFRHADPLLFLHMRDTYSEDETADERKIYFQHNYRSSANIIDGVNSVFESCMDRELTEIDYEAGDHLLVGRGEIPSTNNEIIVIRDKLGKDQQPGEGETEDKLEAECGVVADRIQQLVKDGYQYKDIVILLRARSKAPEIVDWLTKQHIPAYFEGKQSYFDVPEVAMLIEFLKCIDNDHLDIPLITTLKNAPFFFDDRELAEIRADYGKTDDPFYACFNACAEGQSKSIEKKCCAAKQFLDGLRRKAKVTRTSDLIWTLLKECEIYAIQGAMPGGDMRCKNLYALHQRAVAFEVTGHYRLTEFLDHLREITQMGASGAEIPAPLGENDNFVRLMTIHASKGLEFPVVFLLEAQKNIHHNDKTRLCMDMETGNGRTALGLYMPYVNRNRHLMRNTYGRDAFTHKTYLSELAEETRMLYVAMTRAQEQLIVVGFGSQADMEKWGNQDKAARILNTRSMLDMIMPAALGGEELPNEGEECTNTLWTIRHVQPMAIILSDEITKAGILPKGKKSTVNYGSKWHKNDGIPRLPAKTAVTSVISGAFEDLNEDEKEDKDAEDKVATFHLPDEPEPPRFLWAKTEKTAANIGNLFHRYMQLLCFEGFREKNADEYMDELEAQLKGLCQKDVFDEDEMAEIQKGLKGVKAFLLTDIGQKFICEKGLRLYREQDMTVKIQVSKQDILVQGIIDVMYQTKDGKWVIIDYKTDRQTDKETMLAKHGKQLNWYRKAVETITGGEVEEMRVVSLRTGESHTVPVYDPEEYNA